MKQFAHASLFSGIGGAELAAQWMGWENAFHCEIQEFPRRVLEYWFPNSESYEDITKTDFTKWRGRIDILTGGFPCQPFSLAGKRGGADDNRYLWPQMLRAIREIQPSWVVGENVAGLLTMVQPAEEARVGGGGTLFEPCDLYRKESVYTLEAICRDLEREGYAVQPFVVPACAVGAPHKRDRVWIVAHRDDAGAESERGRKDGVLSDRAITDTERKRPVQRKHLERPRLEERLSSGDGTTVADTDSHRQGERTDEQEPFTECERTAYACAGSKNGLAHNTGCNGRHESQLHDGRTESTQEEECREEQSCRADSPHDGWRNFPTQSPVCSRNDGLPFDVDGLAVSFPKWRCETIKAYGNAWVPQVAYEIFRAIEQIENIE